MNKNPIVLCSTVDGTNLTQYLCKTLLDTFGLVPNIKAMHNIFKLRFLNLILFNISSTKLMECCMNGVPQSRKISPTVVRQTLFSSYSI